MKSADDNSGAGLAEAVAHFTSRLVGIGYGQNLMGRHIARQKALHPSDDNPGLTGARSGQDERGTGIINGRLLLVVKPVDVARRYFHDRHSIVLQWLIGKIFFCMLQIIAVITIANIISVLSTWRNACLFGALIAGTTASAQSRFNFQEPVTEVARQQYDLHLLILYIIVAIGVGVFAVMLYSIIYHRKAAGHTAAKFHENTVVEIGWTVIPFFIIMAMAFPATKVILNAKDTSAADLTIKVVGYQWKWSYDYLDDNVFFYSTLTTPEEQIGPLLSKTYGVPPADTVRDENYLLEVDNPMVVPVGRKVRVLLTAADVIHSWWVPQLGVKQDAVPGLVREAWFEIEREGIFRGQCAELCGLRITALCRWSSTRSALTNMPIG